MYFCFVGEHNIVELQSMCLTCLDQLTESQCRPKTQKNIILYVIVSMNASFCRRTLPIFLFSSLVPLARETSDTLFWRIKEVVEGKIAPHYDANLEDKLMLSYYLFVLLPDTIFRSENANMMILCRSTLFATFLSNCLA